MSKIGRHCTLTETYTQPYRPIITQILLGSSCQEHLDTTQHVRRVEPVELVVSSVSSATVRQARHNQNTLARHVERVLACRVET